MSTHNDPNTPASLEQYGMVEQPWQKDGGPYHKGISTRDYFAAKAMQAMSSCNWALDKTHHEEVAKTAYHLADAMLKERAKQ